jgi:putative aminopeptidase FrvX
LKELIKQLVEAYGPSGYEGRVRDLIRGEIERLADEVRTDALGNLIATRRGPEGAQKVMLSAHMDEIGVIVSYVDEKGFCRFQAVGGVGPLTLYGGRVLFENGIVGAIGLEKLEAPEKVPTREKFYIDVGATSREDCPVSVGDVACFLRPFQDGGDRLVAKAMDDRIGCAVQIGVMRELSDTPHEVSFVFTVQEELGLRGAQTSAYGLDPDLGIAVDVTRTGDTPESSTMAVALGAGPAIKVKDSGMIAHPAVKELLVRTAEEQGIPYQLEVLERGSTDACAIQTSRAGVPAGCLSIPCRYVHSPSEMVDYGDFQNAVKLLTALLSRSIDLG